VQSVPLPLGYRSSPCTWSTCTATASCYLLGGQFYRYHHWSTVLPFCRSAIFYIYLLPLHLRRLPCQTHQMPYLPIVFSYRYRCILPPPFSWNRYVGGDYLHLPHCHHHFTTCCRWNVLVDRFYRDVTCDTCDYYYLPFCILPGIAFRCYLPATITGATWRLPVFVLEIRSLTIRLFGQ